MVVVGVWVDREFYVHSEYVFSLEINYLYVENILEKRTTCIFFKYDYEGAFIVLEFIIKEKIEFNTIIYYFVENSTGYSNI